MAWGTTNSSITGANGIGANFAPDTLDRRVEPVERLVLDDGRDLGAEAHPRDGLVRDDAAVRLLDGLDDRLLVERLERPWVDDLDRDALLLELIGGVERLVDESAGRDDGDVLALPHHPRLAERDRLELVRHLFLEAVQRPVLEEDHGVVLVDRAVEEPADVRRRGGEDHLQARDVDEPRLELLRVLGTGRPACAALRPDGQRHLQLPARHVAMLGRLVDDLLGRERQEVLVHDLDDRAHALHRRADPCADDSDLGDRRVADALGAELVQQPLGDAHRAAHLGDVLAHDEDVVVLAHRGRDGIADCFPVRELGHYA